VKVRKFVRQQVYGNPLVSRWLTRHFHRLYYYQREQTWRNTRYFGTDILKCPLDLWIYQELFHELRPDLIIETGTAFGGSAAYMASLCDLLDNGRIITIDALEREGRPQHPRVTYLSGFSTDAEIVSEVRSQVRPGDRVLVILDSDHSEANVIEELRSYHSLVTPGSYCIVEDSNINGHPVSREDGAGPMEAIHTFLAENDAFEIDRSREKFYLTFNPSGYLKRIK
jgi:cephalosporin hydroxylase